MDGILNIDKPSGPTSFSVVAMVRRVSGERRVGHAGTLDPMATGVLPVCFGQATRVIEFLVEATKVYRAQIELGVVTDTYDATGKVVERKDASGVTQEILKSALASFRGLIKQVPPMFSAVKYQGRPLYKLARAGVNVERRSRSVEIYRLELTSWQPPVATVEVECSKGTYIRTLAFDLGQLLGCGAALKSLTRLKYGLFDIKDAIPLSDLEDAFRSGYWRYFVYSLDIPLLHCSAMIVGDETSRAIRHGRSISLVESLPLNDHCRAYTSDGCLLSVLRLDRENRQWQPEKVLL